MKSFVKRAAACGLALTLGLTSLAGCGKSQKIDGTKTVATVNGEALPLGVASFYAKYQQAYMYQLYMMYFGQASSIFDEVVDEESGKTYAEDMKESVLSDLEKMMVINQHAEEYEVSLTDEQKEQIETAAQAYIDANEQSVLDKIGANKDHIAQLMTLQTIQSLMMDPIVKDVDREVTDEEAQQTTLTYVGVTPSEETESNAESAASAAESTTAESTAAESTAAE
ncbi:MAG: hypothetical protein Q4G47_04205, partial [Lachnospiraceae bacterium]|nr:hypothetical protein [Lachnospiraceae bacterium]